MSDTKQPSRRQFLRESAAVVAGTGLAGSLSIARSAHAAGALRALITRTVRPVALRAMCSGCEWLPAGYCEAGLKASRDGS